MFQIFAYRLNSVNSPQKVREAMEMCFNGPVNKITHLEQTSITIFGWIEVME